MHELKIFHTQNPLKKLKLSSHKSSKKCHRGCDKGVVATTAWRRRQAPASPSPPQYAKVRQKRRVLKSSIGMENSKQKNLHIYHFDLLNGNTGKEPDYFTSDFEPWYINIMKSYRKYSAKKVWQICQLAVPLIVDPTVGKRLYHSEWYFIIESSL